MKEKVESSSSTASAYNRRIKTGWFANARSLLLLACGNSKNTCIAKSFLLKKRKTQMHNNSHWRYMKLNNHLLLLLKTKQLCQLLYVFVCSINLFICYANTLCSLFVSPPFYVY